MGGWKGGRRTGVPFLDFSADLMGGNWSDEDRNNKIRFYDSQGKKIINQEGEWPVLEESIFLYLLSFPLSTE